MEVAATSWPRSSTDACYLHSSKARSSASRSAPSETAPLVSGHQAASDANSAKTLSVRVQRAAVIAARRTEQPWNKRRDLFAQLLKAAGLPTRHLFGGCSHLHAWSNFSCCVPGSPCIYVHP